MPLVTVKMLEGRTLEQKRAMVEKVTQAIVETTGATPESVTIDIQHIAKDDIAVAGKLLGE